MAGTIGSNSVSLSENWGNIQFYDYTFNGNRMDFQDLMIAVSEKRAVTVEGEVTPMTTRIRTRNTYLDQLGSALAEATKKEAEFESSAAGTTTMSGWFSAATTATIRKAGGATYFHTDHGSSADTTKAGIAGIIQVLKSTIDGLNNEAQTDMSRLQSLVDRRDESYSTATNLMTAVSDTRSNLIRNL